jgi:hypothetical protein
MSAKSISRIPRGDNDARITPPIAALEADARYAAERLPCPCRRGRRTRHGACPSLGDHLANVLRVGGGCPEPVGMPRLWSDGASTAATMKPAAQGPGRSASGNCCGPRISRPSPKCSCRPRGEEKKGGGRLPLALMTSSRTVTSGRWARSRSLVAPATAEPASTR